MKVRFLARASAAILGVAFVALAAVPASAAQTGSAQLWVDGNHVGGGNWTMQTDGSPKVDATITATDKHADGHAVFVQMRLQYKFCFQGLCNWSTQDTTRVIDDDGANNGGITADRTVSADPSGNHEKARIQMAVCRDESMSGDPCEEWNSNTWDI